MPDAFLIAENNPIENRIFTIRGVPVMLDRDLAIFFQTETRTLKQAVNRNKSRFPYPFLIELGKVEIEMLVSQNVIPEKKLIGGAIPYAFTEQGVAMLTTVIKSEVAILASIRIMNAFVQMRKIILSNEMIFQKINSIELKQIKTDERVEHLFKALESADPTPPPRHFLQRANLRCLQICSRHQLL